MPPKKPEAPKPPPLIGRFGTSLKIGIVGLPNVGYVHVVSNVDVYKVCYAGFIICTAVVDTLLTLSTAGNPPFSMCWPKAKLLQRTSHSAPLTQMRAGCLFPMSALISSANTTSQPGVCYMIVWPDSWLYFVLHLCISVSPTIPPCLFSKVPAFLNVVDIAGLVKGAHEGQGLGNAFLSHISACDGIFHMTRELSILQLLCSYNWVEWTGVRRAS